MCIKAFSWFSCSSVALSTLLYAIFSVMEKLVGVPRSEAVVVVQMRGGTGVKSGSDCGNGYRL